MKSPKNRIRILIATGSAVSFLGGWVLLAHAPKPVPADNSVQLVAPAPLPTLDFNSLAPQGSIAPNAQPLQPLPSAPQFRTMPRLRTHGS